MNAHNHLSSAAAEAQSTGMHRLKPKSSVRGGFIFMFIFATIWILASLAFLAGLYSSNSQAPWWIGAVVVALDLIILGVAVKRFLRLTMVGQTTVDVSSPVAFPGETLEVLVSQPGKFAIDECNVELVCQETATFSAGTDTETKSEIVRTVPVCTLRDVATRDGEVLTRQSVIVPPDAMPSFKSPNNSVEWLIRVKIVIARRPDSEQLFPIRVASRQMMDAEGATNRG